MAFILWHLLQYYQILVKLSSGSYSLNGRLHLLSVQGGGGGGGGGKTGDEGALRIPAPFICY